MIKSERKFANFLESCGKTYKHQPKVFRYNGKNYRPDFYCPEDDTYYEVKTCLQLSEAIRLLKFKEFHPNIKFKIVSPNGYPYYSPSNAKYLKMIERKLNIIKAKDILEISLKEYHENIKDFHIQKREDRSNIRAFRCSEKLIENINKIKQRLK